MKKWRKAAAVFLASAFCVFCTVSVPFSAYAEETTVQYENLRELAKSGNQSLKARFEDYEENIRLYEEMRDILKWEQFRMEGKADDLEDSDPEAYMFYESNAASFKMSASRLTDQIDNMREDKSMKSLESTADLVEISVQSLMNTYCQTRANVEAREKSVEALRASYNAMTVKYGMGAATAAEVSAAENSLSQAENGLASLRESQNELRERLLIMLGLPNTEDVVIGQIPQPDLAVIDAIDFQADREKAVNNSTSVQNTRHQKASGTAARNNKQKQVENVEGQAAVSIEQVYQNLLAKRASYEAALAAYESASMDYEALKRKQAAGMLSNTQYLQGEAAFAQAKAGKETASMALYQAYEDYLWEIVGV